MADNVEASTSSNVEDDISDSIVELTVKTLDSQSYHFNVDKNITVSTLKEKIASQTGLPVVQQRLIFRGKVLKDNDLLSDYHVESGHTLHLVERQPSQSQPSSGATSGGTNTNDGVRGQEPGIGGLGNRIGQISRSVMLGTLNSGDQMEGAVPDLSHVIGSVLNSIGIGSQIGGGMPGMQFSGPVTVPQGNESEGPRSVMGAQGEAGNQSFDGQTIGGQPMPLSVQIPVGAAISIPTLNAPIPDSLNTMSEFMNSMERAFAQNTNQSPVNTGELPRVEVPANSNGGATLEGLRMVLRQTERLIDGRVVAALSHIAGRLEQEAGSTDVSVRGQLQAESGQLGLELQHLGALFLELGRTILTTRLGQSLAESFVNAGPAVYISPAGPNPMMVQPSPLQTGSLFGSSTSGPVNPAMFGPPASGNIPRNVNIHIHAVGPRGANGEGSLGDRYNGSADSGRTRAMPMRNVATTAFPSQPATISVSSHPGAPASQIPAYSLRSASELNSQLRNLVDTIQSELRPPQDQSEISSVDGQSAGNGANETTPGVRSNDTGAERDQKAHDQELRPCGIDEAELGVNSIESSGSSAERSNTWTGSSEFGADGASHSNQGDQQGLSAAPLGLGLGSLQPKIRSRQSKEQAKSGESSSQEQSRAVGQQVLQSLASFGNMQRTENVPSGSVPNSTSSVIDCFQSGIHNTDGQLDIADTMSQVLQSPALGGLLEGVSQQSGIGSPDGLRNMMEQLSQNPAMRNTVSQVAQQIDLHDLGGMFSGMASGQGGGMDLSRMMQQMMPIISQALGGASSSEQTPVETQRPQSRPRRDVAPAPTTTQVDLQQVTRRIEERSPPQEIFRSLIENAVNLNGVSNQENSLNELCIEDELVNGFMHMLCDDVSRRLDS